MNNRLRILCIAFTILPLLPIIAAVAQQDWRPLGYLLWYIFGCFAMSTADLVKKINNAEEEI